MARAPKLPPEPSALEWISAGLGLVVVVSAIGVLAWQGIAGGNAPPEVSVRPIAVAPSGDVWRLDLEATNAGERTAEDVTIHAVSGTESADVTLDYLPGHGRREVSVLFHVRPDPQAVELRVSGWVDP